MAITRLITTLGPTQLLNAMAVLRFQEKSGEYEGCEDILLVGGLYTNANDEVTKQLIETCFEIAKIWNFKAILTSEEIENNFTSRKIGFKEAVEQIKLLLQIDNLDIIYAVRNWQPFNEFCLEAYRNARKICYGDGLGVIDLKPWDDGRAANPKGLVPMDCAYLMGEGIERDENAFSFVPHIQTIDLEFLEQVYHDAADALPGFKDYCQSLVSSFGDRSLTLALPSNMTESQSVESLEDEINLYLSCILPYTKQNDLILVKGHPRQTLGQSYRLVEQLNQTNRQALVISTFSQVPIELFALYIPFNLAITFASISSVSLAYFYQTDLVIGFGEAFIRRYIRSNRQKRYLESERLWLGLARQGYLKKLHAIHYSDVSAIDWTAEEVNRYPARLAASKSNQHLEITNPEARLLLQSSHSQLVELAMRQEMQDLKDILAEKDVEIDRLKHLLESEKKNSILLSGYSDNSSNITQSKLAETRLKLKQVRSRLKRTREELDACKSSLDEIRSSKFWKLYLLWLKLKRISK